MSTCTAISRRARLRALLGMLALLLLQARAGATDAPPATKVLEQRSGVHFEEVTYNNLPYAVVRINLREAAPTLHWKKPDGDAYGNFEALRAHLETQGETLIFATNAGIYGTDNKPLGLHIENGRELRPINLGKGGRGNFYWKPNGVCYVDATGARVIDATAWDGEKTKARWATQSGPALVLNGAMHDRFDATTKSVHLRNGVGVRKDGELVFALSHWPITMHEFASLFLEVLQCPNALYLDGTLSGMYAPPLGRTAPCGPYIGIIAVTDKAAKP